MYVCMYVCMYTYMHTEHTGCIQTTYTYNKNTYMMHLWFSSAIFTKTVCMYVFIVCVCVSTQY